MNSFKKMVLQRSLSIIMIRNFILVIKVHRLKPKIVSFQDILSGLAIKMILLLEQVKVLKINLLLETIIFI